MCLHLPAAHVGSYYMLHRRCLVEPDAILSFILHAAADLKMDGTGLKQALCLQKTP